MYHHLPSAKVRIMSSHESTVSYSLRREADLGTGRIHIWADLVFTNRQWGSGESTTLT